MNLQPQFQLNHGFTNLPNVHRCIKLQYGGDESQNEAWNWLAANQLSTVITTKESRLVLHSASWVSEMNPGILKS